MLTWWVIQVLVLEEEKKKVNKASRKKDEATKRSDKAETRLKFSTACVRNVVKYGIDWDHHW